MNYGVEVVKGFCKVTDVTFYLAKYTPEFTERNGERISSFKTNKFENLVEKIYAQMGVAEDRGDRLRIDLDQSGFSDSEKHTFYEVVSK